MKSDPFLDAHRHTDEWAPKPKFSPGRKIETLEKVISMNNPNFSTCKSWECLSHPPVRAFIEQMDHWPESVRSRHEAFRRLANLIPTDPRPLWGKPFTAAQVARIIQCTPEDAAYACEMMRKACVFKSFADGSFKYAHGRMGPPPKVRPRYPLTKPEAESWGKLQEAMERRDRNAALEIMAKLEKEIRACR